MRLQKYLADAGVASRRKAEALIASGAISVNGTVVTEMGITVAPDDVVKYKGKIVRKEQGHGQKLLYYMLHKPEGYITTVEDTHGRPTVMDLLPKLPESTRLFPIGRLDYNSSGLLIFTNDGDLTYKLTHPKHQIVKQYVARVKGVPSEEALERFRTGIEIDGVMTAPANISIIKSDERYSSLKVEIYEGRNRQIRKMCEAIEHPVASLKRVAVGKVFLGALPKGECRKLTPREIAYLQDSK